MIQRGGSIVGNLPGVQRLKDQSHGPSLDIVGVKSWGTLQTADVYCYYD